MSNEKKDYKRIPQEIPPVEATIYAYPYGAEWYVQKTDEDKVYVKVIHKSQQPFDLSVEPGGHYDEWMGVSNKGFKKGFIIFLDKEPENGNAIVIDKVFRTCGLGHVVAGHLLT